MTIKKQMQQSTISIKDMEELFEDLDEQQLSCITGGDLGGTVQGVGDAALTAVGAVGAAAGTSVSGTLANVGPAVGTAGQDLFAAVGGTV